MIIDKHNDEYIAKELVGSDYGTLLSAGFCMGKTTSWATPSIFRATLLKEHASELVKPELQDCASIMNYNLALNNPDFISKLQEEHNKFMPNGLNLLQFQHVGLEYLTRNKHALLADEMGLGKTVQAIMLINLLGLKKVLVVCPASLKINWRNELSKWLIHKHDIHVVSGNNYADAGIVIINYDVLKRHLDAITSTKWDLVIGDECHAIKNKKSHRTRAFLKIDADRKVLISGTPLLNRTSELWNIIKYLDGATWNNWYGFATRYCDLKKSRFGMDDSGSTNTKELSRLLRATIMVRREKNRVLKQLPKKIRQVIEFPCENRLLLFSETEAYNNVVKLRETYANVKKQAQTSSDPDSFKELLKNLRKEAIFRFSELAKARKDTAIYKIPAIIDHLETCLESEKVICFVHHRALVEAIHERFKDSSVVLYGGTANKHGAVERFQTDPNCKLFIGSIKAAGVGHTLTASNHVVFCEQDWSPGWMHQCEDRSARIGQTKEHVFIQHLVLEGSVDAMMSRKLVEKQEVIDEFTKGVQCQTK